MVGIKQFYINWAFCIYANLSGIKSATIFILQFLKIRSTLLNFQLGSILLLVLSGIDQKPMKQFLTKLIWMVLLIRCTSKNNLVVQHCDTCSQHTDTSKSKTDTAKTALDTIPVSIAIYGDSSFFKNYHQPFLSHSPWRLRIR